MVLIALPETLVLREQNPEDQEVTSGWTVYRELLTDWRILVGMAIAFLAQFRYLNETILLPYAAVRFSWSIGQVNANSNDLASREQDIDHLVASSHSSSRSCPGSAWSFSSACRP